MSKYLDAFNTAARKPATRDNLDKFVTKDCKSCASLKSTLGDYAKKKQRFTSDALRHENFSVEVTGNPDTVSVFTTLVRPAGKVVGEDNKTAETIRPTKFRRSFEVRDSGGTLRIIAIKEAL